MSDGSSKRITQDQWLSKALELFAKTGEGGLRVEKLARSLGVSKSGFYFHFNSREDFLQQLLDYWADEYTEVVTRNPLLLMTPPRERLLMISTLVFEQNLTEFDAAMQVWANKDPDIARQVRKVIDVRLNGYFDSAHRYAAEHFGGRNLYMDAIAANCDGLEAILAGGGSEKAPA